MKHAGQSPYSRNEIVIEMESPEIDDINLVELPGFDSVNTTNNAVLNELLDFYCKNDNVIILSVIPATEDIRKEPTYELVKKYDVHQTKTIGFFFFCIFFSCSTQWDTCKVTIFMKTTKDILYSSSEQSLVIKYFQREQIFRVIDDSLILLFCRTLRC